MNLIETAALSFIVSTATYLAVTWWQDLAMQNRTPRILLVSAAWEALYGAVTTVTQQVWEWLFRTLTKRAPTPQQHNSTDIPNVTLEVQRRDNATGTWVTIATLVGSTTSVTDTSTHVHIEAISPHRKPKPSTMELFILSTVQGHNSGAVEVLKPFEGRLQRAERLPTTDTLHPDTQPSTQEETTGQTGHTAQTGAQRTDRA